MQSIVRKKNPSKMMCVKCQILAVFNRYTDRRGDNPSGILNSLSCRNRKRFSCLSMPATAADIAAVSPSEIRFPGPCKSAGGSVLALAKAGKKHIWWDAHRGCCVFCPDA